MWKTKQKNKGNARRAYKPHLEWAHRKGLLLGELLSSNADIICLQSCDEYQFFQEKLAPRGYVGAFERKAITTFGKTKIQQNCFFFVGWFWNCTF